MQVFVPLSAQGHRPARKAAAMLGIALFASSAAISMGQEKTVKIRLGTGVEIGRKEPQFGSIASVCEDDQANFYVLDRLEHKVFKFSPDMNLPDETDNLYLLRSGYSVEY
jgi:hypothetical protein